MKENYIDIAAFYSNENCLDKAFETTQTFKDISFAWVIPKNQQVFFTKFVSNPIIRTYTSSSLLFITICWLFGYIKKIDNQGMLIIKMVLFQPIQHLPKIGWLRYFILFCILMYVNLDIALQSTLKTMLTIPQYDQSIQNIHEIAASTYRIRATKVTFNQVTTHLDNETTQLLRNKATITIKPPTAMELITKEDCIFLCNNMVLGAMNNPRDVLQIREVRYLNK